MTFLNQSLLFGLAAASIPVLIHLWNRRRFRRVPWAAMRFLRTSADRHRRRLEVEDRVLLAVRCALLGLLALALARPAVDRLPFGLPLPGSRVAAAIVIDNSASMATAMPAGGGGFDSARTRLDEARDAARALVEALPAGSPVAVMTPFRSHGLSTDRATVLRWIAGVGPTDRHGDPAAAWRAAFAAVRDVSAVRREVWFVTDGQAAEWRDAALPPADDAGAGARPGIVLVGADPPGGNLAVRALHPSLALPLAGRPFRIDVEVAWFGEGAARDVALALHVEGEPAGEPWVFERIEAGGSGRATFHPTFRAPGPRRVTASLAGDAVPFDDRLSTVVRVVDEVRVLLVDGDPGPAGATGVSETFFLEQALTPVPPDERAAHPVKPLVVPVDQLAAQALDPFAAVVLANVSDLAPAVVDRLADHVRRGGALLVFPGDRVRDGFYNTLLHARHRLLPAVLASPPDVTGATGGEGDGIRRLTGGALGGLELDEALLADAAVRRAVRLVPSGDGAGSVLLRFDDGTPALLESDFGLGKVFLFATTADTAWNDLPIRPGFVPLVDRLLGAAIRHRHAGLDIVAGTPLTHRMPPESAGREIVIHRIDDVEGAPAGRLATVARDEEGALVRFDETDRAGVFRVAVPGEPEGVLLAVRPSGSESPPALVAAADLERLARPAEVVRWTSPTGTGQAGAFPAAIRPGVELWFVLLVAVIALAMVEMILARRCGRST